MLNRSVGLSGSTGLPGQAGPDRLEVQIKFKCLYIFSNLIFLYKKIFNITKFELNSIISL
jgi:hypothetical protein